MEPTNDNPFSLTPEERERLGFTDVEYRLIQCEHGRAVLREMESESTKRRLIQQYLDEYAKLLHEDGWNYAEPCASHVENSE